MEKTKVQQFKSSRNNVTCPLKVSSLFSKLYKNNVLLRDMSKYKCQKLIDYKNHDFIHREKVCLSSFSLSFTFFRKQTNNQQQPLLDQQLLVLPTIRTLVLIKQLLHSITKFIKHFLHFFVCSTQTTQQQTRTIKDKRKVCTHSIQYVITNLQGLASSPRCIVKKKKKEDVKLYRESQRESQTGQEDP